MRHSEPIAFTFVVVPKRQEVARKDGREGMGLPSPRSRHHQKSKKRRQLLQPSCPPPEVHAPVKQIALAAACTSGMQARHAA
jgi:hypothetical protein